MKRRCSISVKRSVPGTEGGYRSGSAGRNDDLRQWRSQRLAVIAMAEHGNFLHSPDTYMDKIAVGPAGKGVVDLDKTPTQNLNALAEAKKCKVEDLTVIILYRPRHEALIKEVREAGARIRLIGDGDVSAAIATTKPETGIDLLMGIGGAPEGVLAAAALRCVGGHAGSS